MIKLLYPDATMPIPDADLEVIVRLALESRRRVKEQQKRVLRTEFRNTHFSYHLGVEGVEQFVSTPELHSDEPDRERPAAARPGVDDQPRREWRGAGVVSAGSDGWAGRRREDPERAGVAGIPGERAVWRAEPVHAGEGTWWATASRGRMSFQCNCGPWTADTAGHGLGLGVLVALCGALIERSVKGGLIIVGSLNLGGSVEMIPNPVAVAELAVEKGAGTLLMPIAARRQLFDLPDELATKISIEFYADPKDAFLKGLVE